MTAPRFLVDTNVLVYAIDARERDRAARARAWLERLAASGDGVLSAQALTELANVALRKLVPAWTPEEVAAHLADLALAFDVLPVTSSVVLEAVRGVRDHRMSYFDAQVWAAARLHQVPYLLSEDGPTDSTIEGVTFVDPFRTDP